MPRLDAPPDVLLFTDGACRGNPGPGGWAAILKHPRTGKVVKLSGHESATTNNRMELTALIRGLEAVRNDRPWRIHVVSDSEYVINGMTQWINGWAKAGWRRGKKGDEEVKNADLWQRLFELKRKFQLSFEHVYGHEGHPENEECDRLAVQAALDPPKETL